MVEAAGWGWLPPLVATSGFGLTLVALADTGARFASGWAEPLFWAGLLVILVPVFVRLTSKEASRQERIALVVVVGLGLYFVKILHSPVSFTLYDEFAHWRTVQDALQSKRLFGENPLLPISALYPGLESLTHALVSLSQLSVYSAGIVALGAARLVLVLALFLLYEGVSSSRVAGIASVLYMANPGFLFFDAQFSYESVALPMAVFTLRLITQRADVHDRQHLGLALAILLGLGSVITGHHLTSYALAALLLFWSVTIRLISRGRDRQAGAGAVALLCLVGALAWFAYVATLVVGYLAPHFVAGAQELLRLIGGEATGRELFRSYAGQVSPTWERITSMASVVLILLGLPIGMRLVWRRRRRNALALTLAAGALAYPLSLGLRLTESGAETAVRASEFIFVAVAFVLALAATEWLLARWPGRKGYAALTAWAVVVMVGGIILGFAPWSRMPGPYLVAADTRSIEPQGLLAAEWVREVLGPGNRIVADRVNRLLMGTYGQQRPVSGFADGEPVGDAVLLPELGPEEQAVLRRAAVHYVLVDGRMASALPAVGVYFEFGEPGMLRRTRPVDPEALAKFDSVESVSRVFDSGDVVIYDVSALTGTTPPTRVGAARQHD
ncbi:MAG: hypothetical protein M3336_14145 [Chloroflexota bacterium]|nr:hypothetical protein [Chloroflexota bacterium]